MKEPSEDIKRFMQLVEGGIQLDIWMLGIQLQRLRPDIAQRLLDTRDEMLGNDIEECFDATLNLIHCDDNLIQWVINFFGEEEKVNA